MLQVVAVKGKADAAEEKQGRQISGHHRENREREIQRAGAVAAGEVPNERGEQYTKQAAADFRASIARGLNGTYATGLRQRLTAVRALGEAVVNFLSAKWAIARSHQVPWEVGAARAV